MVARRVGGSRLAWNESIKYDYNGTNNLYDSKPTVFSDDDLTDTDYDDRGSSASCTSTTLFGNESNCSLVISQLHFFSKRLNWN